MSTNIWSTSKFLFVTFLKKKSGVSRENPQGGGVFIHHILLRLAEIKTPPQGKTYKNTVFLKKNLDEGF